jgi:hypothetical protein
LDVKTPIATWVLARLFNENHPISRKDLLRHLCQASFDSMTGDKDFANTIQKLIDAKYIEYTKEAYQDLVPVKDNDAFAIQSSTKLQEIHRVSEGYVITDDGIIAFRRQIVTPLEKIQSHLNKIPSTIIKDNRFSKIFDALKSNANILESAIQLCINNAPQILEFIRHVSNQLTSMGIVIPS